MYCNSWKILSQVFKSLIWITYFVVDDVFDSLLYIKDLDFSLYDKPDSKIEDLTIIHTIAKRCGLKTREISNPKKPVNENITSDITRR